MSIEIKENYTPMIKQYLTVKNQLLDAIVFYRLGDFYEMFFDDAKIASKELDLVLTGRNGGEKEKIPMCGIPYHAANSYITKLTQKGYKVAIVEQEGEVSAGKLVERKVVKIVTPGTIIEDDINDKKVNYIASIKHYGYGIAIVYSELSCGELKAKIVDNNPVELRKFLLSMNIKEIVVGNEIASDLLKVIKDLETITISFEDNVNLAKEYEYLIEDVENENIKEALARLINYLEYVQKQSLCHLEKLSLISDNEYMKMDYATKQNLELVYPIRNNAKSVTLWQFLDKTKSSMGSRCLKRWIEYPLINEKEINIRLDAIEYLNFNFIKKDELKEYLSNIYDLDRICTKIAYKTINPKDLKRLSETLKYAPMIIDVFADFKEFKNIDKVDLCNELYELIKDIIVEDPPTNYKDGNVFVLGYSEELDELKKLKDNGEQFILELENKEKERTGISSLKIGYNRVFGYYIEVRKVNLDKIKDEYGYIRKQTLAQAERFITQELKEKENEILQASDKALKLEKELYEDLIEKMKVYLPKLHKLADALSYIDSIYSLSVISEDVDYVRPIFNKDKKIEIIEGRHPILNKVMKEGNFVSNDLIMDEDDDIHLITGPNMGGKSTYMRQLALITIMAQIGCFVPAQSANLMIFDEIFTRIGANDDINSGQSTFMVEMNEANYALKNATENSLILFDEIGRGTSTYDGMSLACAMIEYISVNIKAKTLFSTHYHELTNLSEKYNNINNYHVEVNEKNDHVTFLYKVNSGKADKSYGINVAKLANLPSAVIDRAKFILAGLENEQVEFNEVQPVKESRNKEDEIIIEKINNLNIDNLTPKEALMFLYELKEK